MANTLLERTRSTFEQVEAFDRIIINELKLPTKTKKEQAAQSWKLHEYLDCIVTRSKDVLSTLRDDDGFRKEEVSLMSGVNAFKHFYDKLTEIKQFHRKFPQNRTAEEHDVETQLKSSIMSTAAETFAARFSGEESFGKYLDMHQFFERNVNLKRSTPEATQPSYRKFLDTFHDFSPQRGIVKNEAYKQYLSDILNYFISFTNRSDPLLEEDLAAEFKVWDKEATEALANGAGAMAALAGSADFLDLSAYATVADLIALGGDRLKAALKVLGLKCGGSVPQRAERLLVVKKCGLENVGEAMLAGRPKKRRRKNKGAKKQKKAATTTVSAGVTALRTAVRKLEFLIPKFVAKLNDTLEVTKRNVEQKQIRTWEELEVEMAEEEEAEELMNDDGSSDDEEAPYNPKDIPLGWDGKPIPYWLYKLHGLGVEYKCEICGNHVYKGRRAFDRHFQEWRHAHGMRCLGIPNTKHFHDIVFIQDAQKLYSKIKAGVGGEVWNPDNDEEFEDSDGNVLSKKTYNDLARQGLL